MNQATDLSVSSPLNTAPRSVTAATWTSVVVNTALSLTQIATGVIAHSQGMIADGIHSFSDLVADGVVLVASYEGRKDPDEDHPYGHRRFETGATLALGLILSAVAAGMLSSAVGRLQSPGSIPTVHTLALWVAGGVLVVKESLFRFMLAVGKKAKSSLLIANAWHARSDAASSFVVGLGIVGNFAGYPILDPIAALIVGLMIMRMGVRFGWNALNDLMDRSADQQELQEIRELVTDTPGVLGLHDLKTRKMGDMILVDVHIEVDAEITVEAGHGIAVDAERRLRSHPRVLSVMTHVDPAHRPDDDHGATHEPLPTHKL